MPRSWIYFIYSAQASSATPRDKLKLAPVVILKYKKRRQGAP